MRRLPSAQSALLVPLLLIVRLILAQPLSAESAGIELHIGFSGFLRAGTLTPVSCTLTNRGGGAVSGTLTIRQRDDEILRLPRLVLRREIRIPAGGRFYLRSALPVLTDAYPVTAVFESEDGELSVAEAAGRGTAGGIVLSLSRRRILDFLQREVPGTAVAYPHRETLPVDWTAYEAVRLIFIHDQELPPRPVMEAIATWAATGGELWISVSPELLPRNRPLLELLALPDSPLGDDASYRYGAGRVRLLAADIDSGSPAVRKALAGYAASLAPHLLEEVREKRVPVRAGELHPALRERSLPSPWTAALLILFAAAGLPLLAALLPSPGYRYAAALALIAGCGAISLAILSDSFVPRLASSRSEEFLRRGAGVELVYRAEVPLSRFDATPAAELPADGLFAVYDDAALAAPDLLRPLSARPWHPFIYLLLRPALPEPLIPVPENAGGGDA